MSTDLTHTARAIAFGLHDWAVEGRAPTARQEAYSLPGGIYTKGAESLFSRLRRGEIGIQHHISGPYLVRYAQESAGREDHRRVDNGR